MSAQTGMHPAADALLLDDPLQEVDEAATVAVAETPHQVLFVFGGDLPAPGEETAALRCQVESTHPAIGRVGASLDQLQLLELVDQRDHPAGRGADRLGDRLLRAPF